MRTIARTPVRACRCNTRPARSQIHRCQITTTQFVLPDAETWAVTFVERGYDGCGFAVSPSTTELAERHLLVQWHVVSRQGKKVTLGFTLPSCAEFGSGSFGGNTKTNVAMIELQQSEPFGHPPNCSSLVRKTMDVPVFNERTKLAPPKKGPAPF